VTVRVRFAPSPTGEPHVGNIRTALFNWLFARHEGGQFVLRIEDTDQTRKVPGAVDTILRGLRWLGLDWDEGPEVGGAYGPYFQSERLEHYHRAAQELIEAGKAYRCYCSPERLEQVRAEQQRRKEPPRYDRLCRDLTEGERREQEEAGGPAVVRFKTPLGGETWFRDLIRDDVIFDNSTLDDFVIIKSDGYPTYHLAVVVDDHLMGITHVLRAEEWLPSAPRHLLLYEALGYEPPLFAHLPMVLGKDRARLSKRHGATSILDYEAQGFLPEAMFNFIGLLGWSLDDRTEIISREQFVRHFSIERIVKNPAIFDIDKLYWMNGVYMRDLPLERLAELLCERLERDLPPEVPRPLDRAYVARMVPFVQERLKRLDEARELMEFFFLGDELEYDTDALLGKAFAGKPEEAGTALEAVRERIVPLANWDHESLEGVIRPLAEELGFKTGELFMLIRVAVTGRSVAPPLFQSMEVLGREKCLARLDWALRRLKGGER
jgi:glutamyl-tRNA synthetase